MGSFLDASVCNFRACACREIVSEVRRQVCTAKSGKYDSRSSYTWLCTPPQWRECRPPGTCSPRNSFQEFQYWSSFLPCSALPIHFNFIAHQWRLRTRSLRSALDSKPATLHEQVCADTLHPCVTATAGDVITAAGDVITVVTGNQHIPLSLVYLTADTPASVHCMLCVGRLGMPLIRPRGSWSSRRLNAKAERGDDLPGVASSRSLMGAHLPFCSDRWSAHPTDR